MSSSSDGQAVTIVDDDGVSFTLVPALQEIHSSNGVVITLSPDETAQAASGFMTLVGTDQISNAAAADIGGSGTCGQPGGWCDESPTNGNPIGDSPISIRWASTDPATHRGGHFGFQINPSEFRQRPIVRKSGVTMLSSLTPSCSEIKQSIADALPNYQATRKSILSTLKDIASTTFELDQYGRPTVHLPTLPSLGYALENNMYATKVSAVQMSILVGTYRGYGCTNVYYGNYTGGSLGGTLTFECQSETWEISFDRGLTWGPIQVSVCQYKMA